MSEKASIQSSIKKTIEKKKTSPKKVKFGLDLCEESKNEETTSSHFLKESDTIQEELDLDISLIGEVTVSTDGLILFDDFCRVYFMLKKHVEPRLEHKLQSLKRERRKKLSQIDLESYRSIVLEMRHIEENIYKDLQVEVCEKLGLTS